MGAIRIDAGAHLAKHVDLVQDPKAATMGAQYQVSLFGLDRHVVDGNRGQVVLKGHPGPAAIQSGVHSKLSSHEEETRNFRVFGEGPDGLNGGEVGGDCRPTLTEI